LGSAVGSFLNVVISRVPEGRSVVSPRSQCPACGARIAFYDNIPVLSYLLLRGHCRGCGQAISFRYPSVELLTAAAFAAALWKFGFSPALFLNLLFFSALIALIVIDLNHRILPDRITLPLLLAGLFFSYFQDSTIMESVLLESQLDLEAPWKKIWIHAIQSVGGALAGGGTLWLVGSLYFRLKRVEGLGLGDVKLMAAVGAFLGYSLAWLTIFLGSLFGAIIGSSYMLYHRKDFRYELPFGTFLGAAAILSALWGVDLIRWYSGFYP
ncbi:MAG: prepilin peptidase, partial [Acidobacteria bacterium]|nr:prepilin peptidase [Acidobacteriota bacterium]